VKEGFMRSALPSGTGHPHAIGFAIHTIVAIVVPTFFASCRDNFPASSSLGVLAEGREVGTSVDFAMNGRPVKLELCIRVEGTLATVEVDHPDGRTTEAIEVAGPGIRELRKEFPKEPGSWGLRLISKGGTAAYWVSLHDRKKYIGPDEDARRFVERE
jgi:hypothetical protein